MKAFHFRLEQALRWRRTQADMEKSRAADAANRLAATRRQITDGTTQVTEAAREMSLHASDGSALQSWSVWEKRTREQLAKVAVREKLEATELAARLQCLMETDRKFRMLENLKTAGKQKWTEAMGRELEAFATESFLGRLQSKRTGA